MSPRSASLPASILFLLATAACGAPPENDGVASDPQALTSLTLPSLPQDPNWADGFAPDAIRLGTDDDGTPLYACRGAYGGSLQPGKIAKGWPACSVGYGGVELHLAPYRTLVATWTAASGGAPPPNAFPMATNNGVPVTSCRTPTSSPASLQVGEPELGECAYPSGATAVYAPSYAVLVGGVNGTFPLTRFDRGQFNHFALPLETIPSGTDTDGATLYSCATLHGQWFAGKTRLGWSTCNIVAGGVEIDDTLDMYVPVVSMVNEAQDPTLKAFPLGVDSNGQTLGVCRVTYVTSAGNKAIQVGKYFATGGCNYGYGGREVRVAAPSASIEVVAYP